MYDASAQARLVGKLDYERWLLRLLADRGIFEGGIALSSIKLSTETAGIVIGAVMGESTGDAALRSFVNLISPLVFTASYKMLDMTVEWILEENVSAGKLSKVPWGLAEKAGEWNREGVIQPVLFQTQPFLHAVAHDLYSNLRIFRNEIIHGTNVTVTDDTLTITATHRSLQRTCRMSRSELGAFVRTVMAITDLLTSGIIWDHETERLLRYHADRLTQWHGVPASGQHEPIRVDVEFEVHREGDMFLVDLQRVRRELQRIHPSTDALFSVKVIGKVGDEVKAMWRLPWEIAAIGNRLELRLESYPEHRLPK